MDRSRLNRLPVWFLATVLACVSVLTQQSFGQIVDIPDAIITNPGEQNTDARQTIKAYVEANSKNLLNAEDPQLLKRDRDAILRKLEGQNISVSFRLAYDQEIQPHLTGMLAAKSERIVINGLVIAGELATDRTLGQVMAKLGEPVQPPAIRYEAACSLKRVFKTVQVHQKAVNQLRGAVAGLEGLIAKEPDAHVREALVQAGLMAATIDTERATAISAVSKGVTAAVKAMKPAPTEADIQSLLRSGVGMRNIATLAVQQNVAVPPAAAKDAAEMSGQLLTYIAKVVKANPPGANGATLRDQLSQLATSAQTTIELTSQLLGAQVQIPAKMQANLHENGVAGDARFIEDVRGITGQGGTLTKPPFELTADKFK